MNFYFSTRPALHRRTFLQAAGVGMALPLLDAMRPAFAADAKTAPPRRMLAILTNMGILPQFFFPKAAGRDWESTPYLDTLKDHRKNLTVFSGLSHPEVDGGHYADKAFLTAAPHPGRGGFRNSISLDQFAADRIGFLTRFPSLTLTVGGNGSHTLSWTSSGVPIPGEASPSAVFKRLFVKGTPQEEAAAILELRRGRSVLDAVADRAKSLESKVAPPDREKLDQYFTSVRDLEKRLEKSQAWQDKPKPEVEVPAPADNKDPADLLGRTRLMYDMARLALQTDSTRLITVFISQDTNPTVKLAGVSHGHHSLTHHGNKPENLNELKLIEEAQFKVLAELLGGLAAAGEDGGSLLDRTAVIYGTNMGNANAHSNTNLPVLLAGGGFKHGSHLAFDTQKNLPLANLFVSVLQRLGVEADKFASSTGTLRGLEVAR